MTNLHAKDRRKYPIKHLCRLAGVSKQAYHKRDDKIWVIDEVREAFVVEYVQRMRGFDPGIGGKKLWLMYRRDFPEKERLGRDLFLDILDSNGLKIRNRKRKPRTTDSRHGLHTYPNLIKTFIPTAKNQLWVSDITYIKIWESDVSYHFTYLSLITDAYTHGIIGWCLGPTLETVYSTEALKMALGELSGLAAEEKTQLIHHSDRGVQYASEEYVKALGPIRISMTEHGDPKENAMAERINNTVKNELFADVRLTSIEEARDDMARRIRFYNEERPHMSLGMLTPKEAASHTGELEKKWHSYREQAIREGRIVG